MAANTAGRQKRRKKMKGWMMMTMEGEEKSVENDELQLQLASYYPSSTSLSQDLPPSAGEVKGSENLLYSSS